MNNQISECKIHPMGNLDKVGWAVLRDDDKMNNEFDDCLAKLSIVKNPYYWE